MLAAALLCNSACAAAQSKNFEMAKWVEIQNAILKELDKSYADTIPVDRMYKAAIDAMLWQLDPYTVFVPEEENEDFAMQIGKQYGGIGAIIYKPEVNGPVIINEPYTGSPAMKAGLRCADEILAINGESTFGLETKEATDRMKGQPGTLVTFTVKKAHSADTVLVDVLRERIHLPDIEYYGMLDATTGYIYQSGFTEGVADSFRAALKDLKKRGMKTLVYDLRGNGGGIMGEAISIVSSFLPLGTVAVSQKGKTPESCQTYKTWQAPVDTKLPIILLVDGGSASASEIVAGALQDHDRATIMGRRTYGKGLVQSIRPLPYGGQLKVTTAKYYTPSGRCVQAIDYAKRADDGSVTHIPDSLTHEFRTDSGRIVRDGGGITPDIELSLKKYDDIMYEIMQKGLLEPYILDYVRAHQSIESAEKYQFDGFEDFKSYIAARLDDKKAESLKAEQIVPFIEEEIIVRYYGQESGIERRLRYDEPLKEALEKYNTR